MKKACFLISELIVSPRRFPNNNCKLKINATTVSQITGKYKKQNKKRYQYSNARLTEDKNHNVRIKNLIQTSSIDN